MIELKLKNPLRQILIGLLFAQINLASVAALSGQAKPPSLVIKDFKAIYFSLVAALGVRPEKTRPEILQYYRETMARLPKDGRVEELSSQVLQSAKSLAAMFCREYVKQSDNQIPSDVDGMILHMANRIYNRQPTATEGLALFDLVNDSKTGEKAFLVCTAMTSSLEFLVR